MNIDVATCLNCVYFAYIALIKSIKCIPRMYWVGWNNRKKKSKKSQEKKTPARIKIRNIKHHLVSPFGNLHTHSHVLYNQFVIQFKCLFQHLHLNKVFNDSFHSFILFFHAQKWVLVFTILTFGIADSSAEVMWLSTQTQQASRQTNISHVSQAI